MTTSSVDLLARLASGVVPDRHAGTASTPVESASFATLLDSARSGNVHSGLPVDLPKAYGVSLTNDQADALSRAVDAAAASGSDRLLAVVDDQLLHVDVQSRSVIGTSEASADVVTDINSVIFLPRSPVPEGPEGEVAPPSESASPLQTILGLPETISNASLRDVLADLGRNL